MKKTITVKKREVHKPLLITAITVGAILILSLFLIFQEVLVGKAIDFGPAADVGSAGIFAEGEGDVGDTLAVLIVANVGDAQSVALRFQLVIPPELSLYAGAQNIACSNVAASTALADTVFTKLDDLFVISIEEDTTLTAAQDLRVLRELSCKTIDGNDVLTAEYAALCVPEVGTGDCEQSITGAMEIASLPLRVLSAPDDGIAGLPFYPINEPTLEILDVNDTNANTNNLITNVQAGQLSITAPEVCAPDALDLCSTQEECEELEGGVWDAVANSCSIPAPCSLTNLAACDTLAECESVSGIWEAFTGSCSLAEGEVPPVEACSENAPQACTTETACTGIGGIFADGVCTLPPAGPEIIFAAANVVDMPSTGSTFTTRLIAPAAITTPFQVFTMLFDADDVRLLLEARRIESMSAGQAIDITVDASGTGRTAVRKEVIIYDTPDPAAWTVHTAQKIVHTRS